MVRCLPRALALISAFSTMLLGMPMLSASAVRDAWSRSSIAAAPADFDTAAGSGSEGVEVEEEREEDFGPKTQLFFGRAAGEAPMSRRQGSVGQVGTQILSECWPRVVAIRGPPAA